MTFSILWGGSTFITLELLEIIFVHILQVKSSVPGVIFYQGSS